MAALLVPQLDPGPFGESLDSLGKAKIVDLLHELEDVPALLAGEAVPQAPRRGDVERWCLLVVERAETFERTAARPAELQVLPHDLVDGRALAYQSYVVVADPARHLRRLPP